MSANDTPPVNAREAFEAWARDYFGRGPDGALFDQPADFWLDRLPDGSYEFVRIQDAWLGWCAQADTLNWSLKILHAAREEAHAQWERAEVAEWYAARYRAELLNIASANHVKDQFQEWAQGRARSALAAPPAETPRKL